jgi:EAL domain-containing protein (putative c-di-GMP-specific phosphodiesterase class I)
MIAESDLSSALSDASLLHERRVVVVDDHPANVLVLRRLLEAGGVVGIEGYTEPRLALDRCLQSPPDLLLLDLRMPDLDGLTFLAELRAALPDGAFLPVLVLTADDSAEARSRALASGAKDFLAKPFDATEVVLRARNLLETKALYSRLQRHNVELQAELDEQLAQERREAEELARLARRVDDALAHDSITMVFQPIVSLVDGCLIGVEALARFSPEPYRPPNEWFAEAAAVGRGVELELKAVAQGLAQLGGLAPDLYMSVNASPTVAVGPELGRLLGAYPGDRLVLELTEHTEVADYGALLDALDGARHGGLRIAVDDTGAGYAGLQHLLRLRPNVVKLDMALTRGIDKDPARRALAAALVAFAAEIGAVIVAEGVESADELRTLKALGISAAQGYRLAPPGPVSALRPTYPEAFAGV